MRVSGSRTALVVADDETAAQALSRMLTALDFTVATAIHDRPAALAAIDEARPDVVLIDVDLGGQRSGIELAAELAGDDVPVVLITGNDDPRVWQLAEHDGVYGIVTKPVLRTALRAAVDLVRPPHEVQTRLRKLERQLARQRSVSQESEARERLAVAASRAKTDFLAHMSHELRTPLNAVLGLSEALLERVFGELGDAQATALATIHASGRHLLALINDVLDIARVESGKLPIEREDVVLQPLIDESAALVASLLARKNQRLVIELAAALPPVDIDRRRIKQVLLNLLGNANEFSPPGSAVTLRAARHDDTRQVEIAVSDDGPGIAAADHARIFEPFVILDPSMSRAHSGAGLGLALAKRIVDLHGGGIRVDSEPGRGATFTIALPVSASYVGEATDVRHPTPRRAPPPAAIDGRAILLAEDDDATVLTVRSYLESRGYRVRVVRDGVAALDAAAARDVAMVVMDIQLPGLDGLEVTRRLRARQDSAATPIIALTAHAMSGDEQRCLAAGASAYMAKPVRLRQLDETIGRLLEDRR